MPEIFVEITGRPIAMAHQNIRDSVTIAIIGNPAWQDKDCRSLIDAFQLFLGNGMMNGHDICQVKAVNRRLYRFCIRIKTANHDGR
ncbi:MAG: hypothetical protein IPJ07_17120 [Acidobacteria bacterium]|nr:hypothetical protein [Acidobacteriota bacterium]